MRVIVMLKPTNKYGTKMEYSKFRKYLSQEGFLLVQSEVYIKTVSSRKLANRQITKMRR
ncbi:CRISPR-associated endonuclease Cas2 [Absicoccus porci]|uniref:CRISPR-associated endonuclease Cas2 n=1 Tax=Absicoccus porci TaxID=2486576 RepID=UPI0039B55856